MWHSKNTTFISNFAIKVKKVEMTFGHEAEAEIYLNCNISRLLKPLYL